MEKLKRILLLSTSTVFGGQYLEYAEAEVHQFLEGVGQVLFVPFALHDHAGYAARVKIRFAAMGFGLESLHDAHVAGEKVSRAEAIFIGGGNTFRLLKALYDRDLLGAIRERVESGMPYLGSSAGSNVASPTIRTTNDMPIVEPPSLVALGLIPFQINPHYLDPAPGSTHMGETREERIVQFLEENETPVVGLREGAMLQIAAGSCVLKGTSAARVFRRGHAPVELESGATLQPGDW
ncbi:MAG TPA: dipeptidase PepE [Chthoniobacterales bacterium]|nr:dipeptidase PepE [Chthoniobacterales bacterium]